MLLTEDQIAAAAGLPGPVVAELLLPGLGFNELAQKRSPVYLEEDALKAQIAHLMFCHGIRFRYVQLAVTTLPDDVPELIRIRDFWAQRVPVPVSVGLRLRERGWLVALVPAALMLGIVVGIIVAGLRP